MQPVEVARICSGLRCERCRRAPTDAEVGEMTGNFGGKLDETDVGATIKAGGQCLVWICDKCGETEPTPAEKRAVRARRWAEWKAAALAGGMTQKELDELEETLQKDAQRTTSAIKRGLCPECGAPLGEKPDLWERPFTNVFCSAKLTGAVAHFLVGVDNDELREMRAS